MKLSIVLAIAFLVIIGVGCLWIQDEECPYGAIWSGDKKSIVLPPKSKRKLVAAVKRRKGATNLPQQLIPRTIMQTNEKEEIPQKMADATATILKNNPEYGYVYFTDSEARKFISDHFNQRILSAYDAILPGAYKADLFRYCWMWVKGGIYIDMGMVSLDSLDKIIKPTDTFIVPEDNGADGLYNAFMACAPGHPIIKEAILMAIENIENEDYTNNPLGITGPILLGKAFERASGGEKVSAGRDYGDGVRVIKFNKYNKCESGLIRDGDVTFLATRYPSYRMDQMWYNTKPHYSDMWKKKEVFAGR